MHACTFSFSLCQLVFYVQGAVSDTRSARCSGLYIEISGFRRAAPFFRLFLFCRVAMDVSDMPDLGALQETHMLMQDADSILYPPEDDQLESPPATSTQHRISVTYGRKPSQRPRVPKRIVSSLLSCLKVLPRPPPRHVCACILCSKLSPSPNRLPWRRSFWT